MSGDRDADADTLARKIAALRIFKDEVGKMNLPLSAVDGAVLAVSQFTLAADGMESGNRPGFSRPRHPRKRLYTRFCSALRSHACGVETGVFGADMRVSLVNDGPVTIWFDTARRL